MLPPASLIVAMVCMTVVAIGLGVAIAAVLRRRSPRSASITAAVGTLLLVLHAAYLNGNPTLATLVHSPDAIVWSNFSPLFVAILTVAAWRAMTIRWQRWMVVIALPIIGLAQAYGPIFGKVPVTQPPRVIDGVHHQSTLSTCSAAAAATLLGTIGVNTTETEMATLCLTREGGTLQLGLYRGLLLKARETSPAAKIEFLNHNLAAVLASDRPVIVSLGAPPAAWSLLRPRVGHSVVILSHDTTGTLTLADPMTGRRYPMTAVEFSRIWTGEAMRIRE